MTIQLLMESWENARHDLPEVCMTAGPLRISVGQHSLTRNEDEWSLTVKQTTHVSAYPLAQWLAASWWRLRWEPLPIGTIAPVSWRMAHELPAAGYGFLWPQVVFACDGENMQIWSIPTRPESTQPIHYLTDRHESVPVKAFVDAIDKFMDLVINRLDAVKPDARDLRNLWEEVREERGKSEFAEFRRIEAMLGSEPDELCSKIVEHFVALGNSIGSSVVGEIASACASDDPISQFSKIDNAANMSGINGKFSLPNIEKSSQGPKHQQPWERGQQLALKVRDAMGLNGQAISDEVLFSLAELKSDQAVSDAFGMGRLPVGIAVRQESDKVKFVLRKRNKAGRRFEFTRLLCDHLLSDPKDLWLPATDTKTIRQKWQRAFAAEFLCPIDALISRLGDDFSEDSVEAAADHFGVSEKTVTSQLVNHGHLPIYAIQEKSSSGKFPYLI